MSRFYDRIDEKFRRFIDEQHMFFVATAPREGRVNLSPKGLDTFRVIDDRTVAYLDLTGSGNETAAHVLENGRITFMFVSFTRNAMILRLYGTAKAIQPSDAAWEEHAAQFPRIPGMRQIFVAEIDSIQTSCGYGVPEYEHSKERTTLQKFAVAKQAEGMRQYWEDNNLTSIDGLPTGLELGNRP